MSPARRIVFRIIAVCLGLSIFGLFEGVCRLTGLGTQSSVRDAFSEFASIRPLFTADSNSDHYRIAENRREFFADDSFLAEKPENGRRIFVFGGSTVQGRPFSTPTAFTSFLEIGLATIEPQYTWEVVNCGGISYASYRLVPILEECTAYEPDLFIVCTGHNEFLECVTYANVRSASRLALDSHALLSRLQSFQFLRHSIFGPSDHGSKSVPLLPTEVDAMLDHQGGLEAYSRDTLNREEVDRLFRRNLQQMVDISNRASVPLLFMAPLSNLADCPPFKSEFSTAGQKQGEIAELLRQASDLTLTDADTAVTLLRRAADLDPQFAFTWYQLGHLLQTGGLFEQSTEAFIRARDEDVCPLRMTTTLQQTLTTVADQNEIRLIDLHALLARECANGQVGDSILVDHIHPSFRGHQLIARELMDQLAAIRFCSSVTAEQDKVIRQRFEDHLTSLEDLYFLRGQRTLKALKAWTQGRADGPPLKQPR